MIFWTGGEWDDFGRLVAAVGVAAMLAYLLPGTMGLSRAWAQRVRILAATLLAIALILGLAATAAWFLR
jgi:hypothetical protein